MCVCKTVDVVVGIHVYIYIYIYISIAAEIVLDLIGNMLDLR